MALPQGAVVRRINELVKRARSVKVHAYILHYLKKQMPYVIGRSDKQRRLLDRLDREFVACARRYNLPLGDFPNVDVYRKILREIKDISGFKRLDKNLVYEMDRVLTHDIPLLLQRATSRSGSSSSNGKSGAQYSMYNPLKKVFSSGKVNGNGGGGVSSNSAESISSGLNTPATDTSTEFHSPSAPNTAPSTYTPSPNAQQHNYQHQQHQQYHSNTQPYAPPSYSRGP